MKPRLHAVIEENLMNSHAFDALTRHAGAVSRRGSLRALGGAALVSALAAPARTAAGKARKNKHKNKRAKNPCTQQKAQCGAAVTAHCATASNPALCERVTLPCCEHVTGCNVGTGIACIFATD
jgi:hypothetical protein